VIGGRSKILSPKMIRLTVVAVVALSRKQKKTNPMTLIIKPKACVYIFNCSSSGLYSKMGGVVFIGYFERKKSHLENCNNNAFLRKQRPSKITVWPWLMS
jgi:hypothetical protein